MDGWIKLHRKMLDNPIVCKDSDHLAVWSYILLNATHKEYATVFMGEKIMLQPGQLITGRKVIAEKFNISESKVQRILKLFENEQQIEQQNGNKNRLISILSWSDYQDREQQNEHLVNNNRTTTEQQLNTNKNVKKDLTTTTTVDDPEQTIADVHTLVFGTLQMSGLMSSFVMKLKQKGYQDSFIRELMLETGESGNKPSLRLMETIAERWMKEGIYTRVESKKRKQDGRSLKSVPARSDRDLESRHIEIARNKWINEGGNPHEFVYRPTASD